MRAAVYIRVSSKRQVDEGLSLDEQERRCRSFIEREGWTLSEDHFYREEGISGTNRGRPLLAALVRAIEDREIDVLVSPWIDRIGRSAAHSEELFSLFDAAGIDLWSDHGQRYSGDNASAKFVRRMLAGAAEFERDMLSERVAAVTEAKAERGSYHGGIAPYGYSKGDNGGLVENPTEAKWIRHIFRRYVDDLWSPYRIADELRTLRAPVKRGGQWESTRVRERLDQPVYAGFVKFGEKGKHEPLIDLDTWRKAQELRAANRGLGGNGRGPQPSIHLLSHGLLTCACGRKMRPRKDSKTGRRTYRCESQLRKGSTCLIPAIPQTVLDGAILNYLAHEIISTGLTREELRAKQASAIKQERKRRSEAERRLREIETRLEATELKWIDGKLTDERWGHWRDRFEQDQREARAEIEMTTATIKAIESPDPQTLDAVERLRDDLSAAVSNPDALARYRKLIAKLFSGFELLQAGIDTPEIIEDFPTTPAFTYRQPSLRQHREREHRYFLLPSLQPDLAAVYGAVDPKVAMPDGLADLLSEPNLIDRKGWPWRIANGPAYSPPAAVAP